MKTVRSPHAMQKLALDWKRSGRRVAFVPTMGFLHVGHMSLVRSARQRVGRDGLVVVSIYVNPTQFAPTEDLSRYPRDFANDSRLCRDAGVDCIFAPSDSNMYAGKSEGKYSTYVVEEHLSIGMEGGARPTHFRGVTTIVAKLFNCVLPDVAVFGAKDWQQAAVLRRMVVDLNFPIRMVIAPTHRESDGLAMSSRNTYLSKEERIEATILWRCIRSAREQIRTSPKGVETESLKRSLTQLIATQPSARLDYIECFDPETLAPMTLVRRGTQMALAVFIGKTRLIDNARL